MVLATAMVIVMIMTRIVEMMEMMVEVEMMVEEEMTVEVEISVVPTLETTEEMSEIGMNTEIEGVVKILSSFLWLPLRIHVVLIAPAFV